jgi:hypothetical protein
MEAIRNYGHPRYRQGKRKALALLVYMYLERPQKETALCNGKHSIVQLWQISDFGANSALIHYIPGYRGMQVR